MTRAAAMRRPAVLLSLLAAVAACGKGRPAAMAARPHPTARGTPTGKVVSLGLGPGGGELSLPADAGGTLTVSVPAGAVAAGDSIVLTVAEITNEAPAGQGGAFRIDTGGRSLVHPAALTFVAPGGADAAGLAPTFQDPSGYWLRPRGLLRAPTTVGTSALTAADWTLMSASTARDLQASVTVTSTLGGAFGASAASYLDFWSEDAWGSTYVQWGTITASPQLVLPDATCDVATPGEPLSIGVAEVLLVADPGSPGGGGTRGNPAIPAGFQWGLDGHWDVTQSSGAGTCPSFAELSIDTLGISATGCLWGYDLAQDGTTPLGGVPLVVAATGTTVTEVSGTWVVDCGARGRRTAAFDFLPVP
jgi:hypothetical protein